MRLQLDQTPPLRPILDPCPEAPLTASERTRLEAYDRAVSSWRASFEQQLRASLPLINGNRDPGPSAEELVKLLRVLLQTTILFLDVAVPHTPQEQPPILRTDTSAAEIPVLWGGGEA